MNYSSLGSKISWFRHQRSPPPQEQNSAREHSSLDTNISAQEPSGATVLLSTLPPGVLGSSQYGNEMKFSALRISFCVYPGKLKAEAYHLDSSQEF